MDKPNIDLPPEIIDELCTTDVDIAENAEAVGITLSGF